MCLVQHDEIYDVWQRCFRYRTNFRTGSHRPDPPISRFARINRIECATLEFVACSFTRSNVRFSNIISKCKNLAETGGGTLIFLDFIETFSSTSTY